MIAVMTTPRLARCRWSRRPHRSGDGTEQLVTASRGPNRRRGAAGAEPWRHGRGRKPRGAPGLRKYAGRAVRMPSRARLSPGADGCRALKLVSSGHDAQDGGVRHIDQLNAGGFQGSSVQGVASAFPARVIANAAKP